MNNDVSTLTLHTFPDACLTTICEPIEEVTQDVYNLAKKMLAKMYVKNGIGLAAPQVGINKRMFVVDVSPDGTAPIVFINPVVEGYGEIITSKEGCLSLPGLLVEVKRYSCVKVEYTNLSGERKSIDVNGLLAKCIQHENDHLNGKMCFDELTILKRNILLRKMKKVVKRSK